MKAAFNHVAGRDAELSITAGEAVTVVRAEVGKDWWQVENSERCAWLHPAQLPRRAKCHTSAVHW